MKIIKEGRSVNEVIRFECKKCGCIFVCREDECQSVDMGYQMGRCWKHRCPNCGTLLYSGKIVEMEF